MIALLLRHKLITAIGSIIIALAAAGALLLVKPRYEVQASFALLNPVNVPSVSDLAVNPGLATGNTANPLLGLTDNVTAAQLLTARMNGDTTRQLVASLGADEDYEFSTSQDLTASGRIIGIEATGESASAAIQSMSVLTDQMNEQLVSIQTVNGATAPYLITVIPAEIPTEATPQRTNQIRMLVGVALVGGVLLFISLAVADRRLYKGRPTSPPTAHENSADEASA